MVDKKNYYRASEKLTAAIRDFRERRQIFTRDVINPWMEKHPNQSPWVNTWTGRIVGFADDASHLPPPEGLSRSSRRDYLIPVRGKAGDPWLEQLKVLRGFPFLEDEVWRPFDIPAEYLDLAKNVLHLTVFVDFADEGGMVVVGSPAQFDPLPEDLTPMKTSEFYRLAEAYEENHPETEKLPMYR